MRPYVRALILACLLLTAAAALSGCGAPARNRQGNRLYADKQYDQALLAYQAAQAELPEQPELHYNAGNALHRLGDFSRAISETLRIRPDAPADLRQRAAYNLGNSLYRADQFAAAVEAYKEALRLDPNDQDAKHNLELALKRLEEQQAEQQQQQEQQEQQGQQEQTSTPTPSDQGGPGTATPTPTAGGQGAAGTATPTPAGTPGSAPAQAGMTPQQALQLLQSLAQDEKSLQQALEELRQHFPPQAGDKDW